MTGFPYFLRETEGVLVREFMRRELAHWRDEVPEPWREIFGDAELCFAGIPDEIVAPDHVFPLPHRNGRRHLLRPFDGIAPVDVRVILIGQDPYPDEHRATGRAFEDGIAVQLSETDRPSLRQIVKSCFAACQDRVEAVRPLEWAEIDRFILPNTVDYFDDLSRQGVLCLNAAWTFTDRSPPHLNANLRLWRPIMCTLIEMLLRANQNRVVLTLGAKARKLADGIPGVDEANWVCAVHPQARGQAWANQPNPFVNVNNALNRIGQPQVCWMPGLREHEPDQ